MDAVFMFALALFMGGAGLFMGLMVAQAKMNGVTDTCLHDPGQPAYQHYEAANASISRWMTVSAVVAIPALAVVLVIIA